MNPSLTCEACGGNLHPWFQRSTFSYVVCGSCKTTVTNPIPTATQINRHYQQKFKAGNYLLLRQFSSSYLRIYQQFVDTLLQLSVFQEHGLKGKKVLDVGCFTGEFLELMDAQGADVYGTELQASAVKIANKKFPGKIFLADVATKDFPKKKFDIVSLLGLIEHVTDPNTLLKQTTKLLKKDGVLLIQTPDAGSWLAKLLGPWWPPLTPVEHIHVFSANGLRTCLIAHGYTDIHIVPHVKWLPVAYVYHQFSNFGTHFLLLLRPFGWFLTRLPAFIVLPFYGGEMIVSARKM